MDPLGGNRQSKNTGVVASAEAKSVHETEVWVPNTLPHVKVTTTDDSGANESFSMYAQKR